MSEKKLVNPSLYDVIVSPIVTEKSHSLAEHGKVVMFVSNDSSKPKIKEAVEKIFDVKVDKVNVINVKGKTKTFKGVKGRRSDKRKAIITLKEGENIDVLTSS